MDAAKTDADYMAVRQAYDAISSYKDSAAKVKMCEEKALEYRYQQATEILEQAKTEYALNDAIDLFQSISGWKNSDDMVKKCEEKIEILENIEQQRLENEKQKAKLRLFILFIVTAFIVVGFIISLIAYDRYSK